MDSLLSLALTALLLIASGFDVTRLRIPNAVPLAVIGLCIAKAAGDADALPWLGHLGVFALALALGFVAFAGGLIGGGDAKLIAALALWFGPQRFASFIAITGVGGGVFALLLLVLRRTAIARTALAGPASRTRAPTLLVRQAPIPYALPITVAVLVLEWL